MAKPALVAQAIKNAERARDKTAMVFGHCSTADLVEQGLVGSSTTADEWHRHCRGTAPTKGGAAKLCACKCHDGRCRDCGQNGVELVPDGTCVDRAGCLDVQISRADTPERAALRQQLAECREEGKRLRAAAREERAARVPSPPEDAESVPEANGSTKATPSRPAAPRREGQRCHCGCGEMTKGGLFAMGHDAKLKGRLFAIARDPKSKKAPANSHRYLDRVAATAEIQARGWNEANIPDDVRRAAGKNEWDIAPDVIINRRVKERYETAS